MNQLPLFDLHCDTLYEARKRGVGLIRNELNLNLTRLNDYKPFCQTLAMWSDSRLDGDTAYKHFFEARELLTSELTLANESGIPVRLCTSDAELTACESEGVGAVFLAIEGGKLICRDLDRLNTLCDSGVRFLTLTWSDPCPIGGCNGTDEGITEFGVSALERCFSLGIIPDVSHASDKLTDDVAALCERQGHVCIATHSNSRTVCDHSRNLTDERFSRIAKLGGIVGISLSPPHLTTGERCTIDDIVRHIEHYMSLGGEDAVCLGCDLDGISRMPEGIKTVSDIEKIADSLGRINYTDALIKKIFYANARNFISLWLK